MLHIASVSDIIKYDAVGMKEIMLIVYFTSRM